MLLLFYIDVRVLKPLIDMTRVESHLQKQQLRSLCCNSEIVSEKIA